MTTSLSRAGTAAAISIVLVASPMILGELRDKLHQEVTKRVVAEVDKTLTNHPVDEIEKILQSELDEVA